ncbi:MBL fold metallo-hydrolase [Streptomyces sp. NPDC055078]
MVVDGAVYLVDCGDGALRRYRDAGLGGGAGDVTGFENLRAFFLTHLHPDHYVDLPGLYLFAPVMGLARGDFRPVRLYGPGSRPGLPPVDPRVPTPPVLEPDRPTPGFADLVASILAGNATTLNESMRDTGRADPRAQLEVNEVVLPGHLVVDPDTNSAPTMRPFDVYEDDRVRVSAILVPHGATYPSFAYRFDSEHGSVVISGDTSKSDNVARLAHEADILVHEVVDPDWARNLLPAPLSPRQEALVDKLVDAHTPIAEVGSVATAAGARTLVLSHLSPANLPDKQWLRQIRGFRGRVRVARDLGIHRV